MKKKISIVISLVVLFNALFSCVQEDQVSSNKSTNPSIIVDKNSVVQLEPTTLSKDDIEEESCKDPVEHIIYAGQHIDVGNLKISNSDTELFVTYDVSAGNWWLSETHLFVGDIEDAPFNNSGNPKIGNFPYHGEHELTKEYTFVIPLDGLGEEISIIAHAVVIKKEDGQTVSNETAFGFGEEEFEGSRWGWIISYEKQDCNQNSSDESTEGSSGSSDGNDQSDDSNSGGNNEGCMDAYAYQSASQSTCFLNDFSTWGWTNSVPFNDQFYYPGGVTYTYPLYASAFQCDIDNSIPVGEVRMTISGGDSILYANIAVNLTNDDLIISALDIYAGQNAYPLNEDGNNSISFEDFDVSLDNLNVKSYEVDWVDWFSTTNFIIHVQVCPEALIP